MSANVSGFELYMWISFYVFLLPFAIILTAKLIQYFRRWGVSKSVGLEYTNQILSISIADKIIPITFTIIKPKSSNKREKILLITPITVSAKRYLYLATSLALNNYEVILIESRENIFKIRKEQIDPYEFASEVVKVVSPNAIVASDVFFPLLLPEMQKTSGIRFVFLRPVVTPTPRSLLTSLFLSIPWISRLLPYLFHPDQKELALISNKVLCIFPKVFLMKHRTNIIHQNLTFQFIRSRISFRDKETMVFALIMQFIGEASS